MGSHDAKAECSQRFELDSNVTPSAQYLYSKRPIAVEIMLESASRTCSSRHVRRHRAMVEPPAGTCPSGMASGIWRRKLHAHCLST